MKKPARMGACAIVTGNNINSNILGAGRCYLTATQYISNTKNMTNVFLDAALSYAERGWAVFPLHPRSKVPATQNGFKDATTDEAVIRSWWGMWPEANIGIATGSVSNLVVIDVDKKHGGWDSLHLLGESPLTTFVATGGGGGHFYFAHPGVPVRNKAGLVPGIDVRADGGYVVAAPSIHENGSPYVMEINTAPAQLPPSLLAQLQEKPKAQAPAAELREGERGELSKHTYKFIAEGAAPGTWHQAFYKAAMDLKQNGYTFDEAKAKLESGAVVLDESHDVPQLLDVYANREPKHPPRVAPVASLEADDAPVNDGGERLFLRASELALEMSDYLGNKNLVKGKPTLFDPLDKLLGGGKRKGEVTAWHAEAKTGKNTFWHFLMFPWLEAGVPLGYASRELTPATEVLPDLLSVAYRENARLSEMTAERIAKYGQKLSAWPLYFAEGYGYFEIDRLRRWVDELQKLGVEYFWFDHLHYMLEDPEEHKEASKLAKEIKALAKSRDVHIDLIVQPNKLMEGQRLSLNSLKGGSAIGQAIDNLITIERVRGEPGQVKNIRRLSLDVARSKLAKPGHIYIEFDPDTLMFAETELCEAATENTEPYSPGRPQPWGSDYRISS